MGYWSDFGTYRRHLQCRHAVTGLPALLGTVQAQILHMLWSAGLSPLSQFNFSHNFIRLGCIRPHAVDMYVVATSFGFQVVNDDNKWLSQTQTTTALTFTFSFVLLTSLGTCKGSCSVCVGSRHLFDLRFSDLSDAQPQTCRNHGTFCFPITPLRIHRSDLA